MRIEADRIVRLSPEGRAEVERVRALGAARARRRRMSIEHLALCHVAAVGQGLDALGARAEVTLEEVRGLVFGQTFGETLLLSGPLLDLYEEEAHVGPRRLSSPVESGARALRVEAFRRLDVLEGGLR